MRRWRRWVIPLTTLVAALVAAVLIPAVDAEPAAETTSTTMAMETPRGPGVDDHAIRLGVLAVTTGESAGVGFSVVAGHSAYWGAKGEIGVRAIDLDVQNGALDAATSAAAYRIMDDRIAMVSSSLGTSLIAEAAASDGVMVIADSTLQVWSNMATVIPNAGVATPADEVRNGLHWAYGAGDLAQPDTSPLAIVVGDDLYGTECLNGLNAAATDLDLTIAAIEVAGGESDLAAIVDRFQVVEAAVVVVCASPSLLTRLSAIAAGVEYRPVILATSASYDPQVGGLVGDNVYVITAMPPWESDYPGVVEMRRAAAAAGIGGEQIDVAFYIGYTQAATAAAILEAADQAGEVSREGFISALVGGIEVDLGMGGGVVVIGFQPPERIPAIATGIYRPVPTTDRRFGLEPVAAPFVVPATP